MMSGELSKAFFEAVTSDKSTKIGLLLNLTFVEDDKPSPVRIDINAIDPISGMTALGIAAKLGNHATLLALLDRKADLGKKDPLGKTALQYAVEFEQSRCIETLLEAGGAPAQNRAQDEEQKRAALERFNRNIDRLDKMAGSRRRPKPQAP